MPMASSMQSGSDSSPGSDSGSLKDDRLEKRPRISSGIDRLSDLPDPLICHILDFLPTKTVVATSILATRWKSLWTKVTSIDVSFDAEEDSDRTRFAQIVNQLLLSRNAERRLDKFRLDWDLESEQEAECVNKWVSYAIARGLRFCSLRLGMGMGENEINLPSTLFTCKSLESLELSGWFKLQVPTLVCLPKLQVLDFNKLSLVSNESIYKFISGCPVLHSLTIRMDPFDIALKISSLSLRRLVLFNYLCDPVYDKKLEIDAPNLEFLHLDVCASDCSIKCPSAFLNEVILHLSKNCVADSYADFVNGVYHDRCNSTVKLVETLNRAKLLTLSSKAMMAIGRATIPLSTRFERLTKLNVSVESSCEWSSLNALLGRCSRLQWLTITAYDISCDVPHEQWWKEPEQVPECLLSSLTRVSFPFLKGFEDGMSLVRYLLKHGSVLESVDVYAPPSSKFQMLQEISKFPRLSSACSVEFI